MKSNKIILSFIVAIFGFLPFISSAQVFIKEGEKNLKKMLSRTVSVETGFNEEYNRRMSKAFKDYWSVTPFISRYESDSAGKKVAESALKNTDELFTKFTYFKPQVISVENKNNFKSTTFVSSGIYRPYFIFGMNESYIEAKFEDMGVKFFVDAFYYEFDATNTKNAFQRCLLRLPYMVYNLNDMLTYYKKNNSTKGYESYVDEKAKRIATKTLLIPKNLFTEYDVVPNSNALNTTNQKKTYFASILDIDKIGYSGKYLIKTADEIMKLEQSPEAGNYALFMPALDDKKYMMVYDLKTKELLYFESTNMSFKIKDKDFKKLNNAIGF